MTYFTELPGECAILLSGGIYREAPLYEYELGLYAKFGPGFVRLAAHNETSRPRVRWVSMTAKPGKDSLGRLTTC